MFTQLMKIMLSVVVFGTMVACSQNTDLRSARATGIATGVTGSGSSSCGTTTQTTGRIYDGGGTSSYTFEQRVKGLLSSSIDPSYFGTISGSSSSTSTGVSMEGHIAFDSSGNLNISQTNLKLTVTDSYVGQTDSTGAVVQAYPINFSSASSGTVNLSAKTFSVVFKDNYGEITVTGSFSSSMATGTVSYANYQTAVAGNYPSSGTLGSFQISTCSFVY
ncbi:MAG: hypothetical protein JSU04_08275 [Bdellovibrionales bacterium]|nr:hypothetical protein [Bdellovibrionales bacterium]